MTVWLSEIKYSEGVFPHVHLVGTKKYKKSSAIMAVNSIFGSNFGIFDLMKSAKKHVVMVGQNHWYVINSFDDFKSALLGFFASDPSRRFDILMCDSKSSHAVETWKSVTGSEYEKHLFTADKKFDELHDWAISNPVIGNKIRIRKVEFVPVSINFVDPEEESGFLVMTPNVFQDASRIRPSFILSKSHSEEIFNQYWSRCGHYFDLYAA